MQQEHLKTVAQIFGDAGLSTGNPLDNDAWEKKFKLHIDKTMADHASRLKAAENSIQQKAETFRARFALCNIVEERLHARVAGYNSGIAQTLKSLQEVQATCFKDVLSIIACTTDDENFPGNGYEAAIKAPTNNASTTGWSSAGSGKFAAASRSGAKARTACALTPGTPDPLTDHNDSNSIEDAYGRYKEPFEEEAIMSVSPKELLYSPATSTVAPVSPGSPARDVFRGMRCCNSYAERYLKTRPFTDKRLVDTTMASRPGHDLTLRHLRDVMARVYASKIEHDKQCLQANEPLQTMEQHLYYFLGQRYGTKEMVQEWTAAIFRSLQKYAPRECDVSVFGKVLQNKLAEPFPGIQDALRQTLQELLRSQLTEKYPERSEAQLDSLWQTRLQVGIPFDECKDIVGYMYNEADSAEVANRLQQYLISSEPSSPGLATSPIALEDVDSVQSDCIHYKDLLHILLSFQIHLTESFLADFVRLFREVNVRSNGVLNKSELQELVRLVADVAVARPESRRDLDDAEAIVMSKVQNLSSATFSQCVDFFSQLISVRAAMSSIRAS